MKITLTVTAGPSLGRQFVFSEHDNFIVGRAEQAHFRMAPDDMYFSRFQFMVELNPPRCRLVDMNSRNGTCVNGKRVMQHDLVHGDRITAGKSEITVEFAELDSMTLDEREVPTADWPEGLPPTAAAAPTPSRGVPVAAAAARKPLPPPAPTPPAGAMPVSSPPAPVNKKTTPDFGPTPAACPLCEQPFPIKGPCPRCIAASAEYEQRVPGYRMVRMLGRGATGVVHLAYREADGSVVAIKTVLPDQPANPTQFQRFLREANILKELDHPHIVGFRDMGETDGQLFFAMEYVRGIDAQHWLKKNGPMPVVTGVRLIVQALLALEYAHAKGFVHRDIKPANLLLTRSYPKSPDPARRRSQVKLADFGLARLYQASQLSGLTMTGDFGGTPAFMPPEQITSYRDVKPAADLYSVAATLYNLLTTAILFPPYKHHSKLFVMILQDQPVPIRERRPEVPAGLAEVIHRCLEKDPDARFPDARSLRKALAPYAAG